ncbi:MAG: hypothetical protein QG591_673 [Planctomycetota bacterium]|jgi:hypothetical protein|nr:hypothetical protein [Planctomycetota bacterium]
MKVRPDEYEQIMYYQKLQVSDGYRKSILQCCVKPPLIEKL